MLRSRELSRQFSFGVVVRRQILGQREQICSFEPFSVVKLHRPKEIEDRFCKSKNRYNVSRIVKKKVAPNKLKS